MGEEEEEVNRPWRWLILQLAHSLLLKGSSAAGVDS